jgi:hypothetical protein
LQQKIEFEFQCAFAVHRRAERLSFTSEPSRGTSREVRLVQQKIEFEFEPMPFT